MEGFFRSHLLGKMVSRFLCQNVVLLCLGAVILFLSKSFMDHISRSSSIRRYFQVLSFFLLEGFKVSKVCFIIFWCNLSVFIKGVLWIFWFTFSGVQVSECVCHGFVVRVFKLSFCLSKTYSSPVVYQKVYGLVVGGFLYVQSVRGFSIKKFLQVLFFFVFFCGFTCVRGFF